MSCALCLVCKMCVCVWGGGGMHTYMKDVYCECFWHVCMHANGCVCIMSKLNAS